MVLHSFRGGHPLKFIRICYLVKDEKKITRPKWQADNKKNNLVYLLCLPSIIPNLS